ncbi:tripartite tricarboxylate transporter substrate binding protein [Bradyrhizobium sp. LHD-71]|uniref:Bug family tripartite tricarboxylate transporter substrate binding protein n=1 Tax=Bradyrhizobium sp. LHD-71 TaxID=3072141 RepID=UPI00280EBC99|nr:tripartite tricarboxylate transporter substrate binding protein [Bradyrhizobium sp. LHD-71]MDQ8730657.1 tripartite tricarboxylate transporter substrate binding protein [Bradyrhizobium sp. LHD-71]
MSFDFTRRNFLATGAAAATLPILGTQASAQAGWPNKPIRVIAGYPAGGQTDLFARTYGDVISKKLGQPIVVENKAGAGGTVAALEVKRAAPDGYTWQFTISTTLIMNRVLLKDVPYDADKDFILISIMPSGSLPLVASAKTGAKTLKEFIDYCRKTERVSVGTYAAGSYAHMAVAELNKQYGLKIEPVHYRGESPMWADVAGQTLDGAVGSYGAAQAVLQGGRGQAVAVSRRRNPLLPDVPTFKEQGTTSKCFELTGFQSCSVPAGTPIEIVKQISNLLVEAGKSDKVQEMMKTFGVDEAAMTFDETQKLYNDEKPIWLELVKSLGLEPT